MQIITETLAATVPTVVVYVVDTPRCTSPTTFMSNMLYACSIMYKVILLLSLSQQYCIEHCDIEHCVRLLGCVCLLNWCSPLHRTKLHDLMVAIVRVTKCIYKHGRINITMCILAMETLRGSLPLEDGWVV